jgi:hypothetical protein
MSDKELVALAIKIAFLAGMITGVIGMIILKGVIFFFS